MTGVLALPPLAVPFVAWLHRLSGAAPPVLEPVHVLFVSLAGALGVLWAVVRLRDPRRDLVTADAIARLWVAALLVWSITQGAPPTLFAFVATELAGTIHQARALTRA